MPSSVLLEHPPSEETPFSTALMAQTPLPQTALLLLLPLPLLLPHGVPSLESTDQPITSLASSSSFGFYLTLNDTYALIGALGVSSSRGNAYLYRLDGSDAFTSTCATTGTLTSPWCTLSQSTDQPITSLANGSRFGSSAALNDTYALIGARGVSTSRGDAFLYRLDGSDAFTSNCATALAPLLHHGVPSLNQQTNQSPPLLTAPASALPLPSTTPMPLLEQTKYPPSEETPSSTALMAQTPLPPPALPPAPLLHHGVPFLNQQTNQSPPLLVDPFFGFSVALNDTYALIGANQAISFRGEAYLYRLDGTNAFNSSCEIVGSVTTPWCAIVADAGLSLINNSIASGDFLTGSFFGFSVALSNTAIVIGATRTTEAAQGNAFRILSGIIMDTTTTFFTPTQVQTMLSANNVTIMANNDITILSSFTYTGTNTLTLTSGGTINANPLNIQSSTTLPTITVPTLTINASGNVGSSSNPLFINVSNSLTITPGTANTVFLAHPTNPFIYLTATINSSNLSLTQTTGDITISSAIDFSGTNLTLIASAGSILTTLSPTTATITADELTLTASDTIGSVNNPLYLITTTSLTITPDSTSNTIYLSHPTDVFSYLTSTLNSNSLSLTQTTGDINITDPINEASLNLELRATGTNASINIQNNITADTLTLFAINTITTTSSNNLITAPTINLQTMQGDIGTTTNRIYLSSGESNPPFTSLTLIALTTNSNIYIRANQNSNNNAFTAIRQQVIDNNPNPTSTYTVTIFNDESQAFSQDNDLRFTVPPPRTNNDSGGFFASITDIILSIFGDDCDDDDSDFVIVSDVIQILCF